MQSMLSVNRRALAGGQTPSLAGEEEEGGGKQRDKGMRAGGSDVASEEDGRKRQACQDMKDRRLRDVIYLLRACLGLGGNKLLHARRGWGGRGVDESVGEERQYVMGGGCHAPAGGGLLGAVGGIGVGEGGGRVGGEGPRE